MSDGFGSVSVVALFAIVTVSSGRVVAALQTDTAADASGQFEQLHVETAAAGVQVAVAS